MHLMSLIIGMVLIGYILFNAIRNRRHKKNTKTEVFEEIILEKTQNQFQEIQNKLPEGRKEHDPLLDDYAKEVIIKTQVKEDSEPNAESEEEGFDLAIAELPDTNNKVDAQIYHAESVEPPRAPAFVAMTILPKQSANFSGKALIAAFHKYRFYFGKQDLYHRHFGDDISKTVLYSIASIVEPGYFEQASMLKTSYAGLIIYMLTSDEMDPVNTFEKMLTNARQLAATLNAELCDIKRQPLTTQALSQMRERIKEDTIQGSHRRGQQGW